MKHTKFTYKATTSGAWQKSVEVVDEVTDLTIAVQAKAAENPGQIIVGWADNTGVLGVNTLDELAGEGRHN